MQENKYLEFKEEISNTFLKTVSAYANYGTGKIMFGIDDTGKVKGITNLKEECLSIENRINDSINPHPDFILSIDELKSIIILEVKEGNNKPYLYKGKAYKRNDTSTIEVDNTELRRLILESQNMNFEDLKSNNQNLTFDYLKIQFKEILDIELDTNVLKTLELLTNKNEYINASNILSDQSSFPGIDIVKFGENINIIRDRMILSNQSILKSYDEAVEMYKKYYQYETINGINRTVVESIPEVSFREALANAIIHRVWDINASIRISMWDDKIEIVSPGGLPSGINQSLYLDGMISIMRNPILGNTFFRLKKIEKFGTGIKRIKDSYNESKTKPEFKIDDNYICIVLPLTKKNIDLSEDEQLIFNTLSRTKMSSSELLEVVPFGRNKTIQTLTNLVEKGVIIREGTGRGIKYYKK